MRRQMVTTMYNNNYYYSFFYQEGVEKARQHFSLVEQRSIGMV